MFLTQKFTTMLPENTFFSYKTKIGMKTTIYSNNKEWAKICSDVRG